MGVPSHSHDSLHRMRNICVQEPQPSVSTLCRRAGQGGMNGVGSHGKSRGCWALELSPHGAHSWSGETCIETEINHQTLSVAQAPSVAHCRYSNGSNGQNGNKSGHQQVSVLAIISISHSRLSTADFDPLLCIKVALRVCGCLPQQGLVQCKDKAPASFQRLYGKQFQ